ncbi:MAG: DUF4838 domain-containing protein [Lacunisphaera sp.]|nr:DUF4838 domain-containing protein [Lacunisphaera sp.]
MDKPAPDARQVRPASADRILPLMWAGLLTLAFAVGARADVELVRNGEAVAVVVIADDANAVSRYAAEEIVYHVRKATGATLPILTESAASAGPRICVGATRAARKANIAVDRLAPETAMIVTTGTALIIVGGDAAGDPLATDTFAGTLFGVYEWLERDVGVRWLWPGELGTYVPELRSLRATTANLTVAPRFFQRNVRPGLTFKGEHAELGFTPAVAGEYARDLAIYLRRHRMGRNVRLSYGHAFTDWWAKYGAEHPEWFQLVKGKRGPTRPGGSYSMCVSNPELHRKIVELWRGKRMRSSGAESRFVNAIENGIMGLCECDSCRAWDGPQPDGFLEFYPPQSKVMGSRFVTDRYTRFWLAVQREAAKTDPTATVVAYNYFNYFHPPTAGTRLGAQILVGSYPSAGWYPRSAEEQAWFLAQWSQWQETGARLFSRGNYCLDGYNLPWIFAHQFADEFRHQVRHGMEATDYDALTGHWATQGPNLYLLMRLHTRPDASAEELLAEYYGGFGAAAPAVKDYFDHWERHTQGQREQANRLFADNTTRWRAWATAAHLLFPPESFVPAEAILARAAVLAADDPQAAARVGFLRAGLAHARLEVDAARELTLAGPAANPERGAAALAKLIAFRRAHERSWISNFNHAAWVEDRSWRLAEPRLLSGSPSFAPGETIASP